MFLYELILKIFVYDQVPALVLDCEPNIDFSKDIEAKREYAPAILKPFSSII